MIKKIFSSILILTTIISISACKKQEVYVAPPEPLSLSYYKLFDNQENIQPIFDAFQKEHPHVTIVYRKFNDPKKYLETIVSEIAEGGGPDIMSVPNTWIAQNYKKLSPAPSTFATAEKYQDTFVNLAFKDNVLTDSEGQSTIYGIPLYVDTLALFYNDNLFEAAIPERGKPSETWEGLVNDINKLTKLNNSKELLQGGIALGRGDNINRAADIFYLLLMQQGVEFYKPGFKETDFGQNEKTSEIVKFLNNFAEKNNNNYTWDTNLVSADSNEKEILAFAQGKTAMMLGYAYQYKELLNQIELQNRNGILEVSAADLKVIETPQFKDSENPVAYASYMTEVVSRNSKNSQAAWDLLGFMVKTENLQAYYSKDFKPTSKRELLPSQEANPIYGPFVKQIAYAKTMPIQDTFEYKAIIQKMITESLNNNQIRKYLINAQSAINQLIPSQGAYPFVY